jgi:hypothetical protein
MNIIDLFKIKIIKAFIFYCISMISLSSCRLISPISDQNLVTPTTYETDYSRILKTADSPNNKSLSLEIYITNNECYTANTDFLIQLKFHNSSKHSLFLQNRFFISNADINSMGDIILSIYLLDGTKAFNYYSLNSDNWPPPHMDYINIDPLGTYIHEFAFRIPDKVIDLHTNQLISTSNQNYRISVTYSNYSPLEIGAWVGSIESNRISICIK